MRESATRLVGPGRPHVYHFLTTWRLTGSVEEVVSVFQDGPSLLRWWPSAFLDGRIFDPGGADGIGRALWVHTKGWLPYTMRLVFRVVESDGARRCVLAVSGDFEGRSVCTADQDGAVVLVRFDWKIQVRKPLLRRCSWLLKPVFAANHGWVMRRGLESLALELARRRADLHPDRPPVSEPPPATFPHGRWRRGRAAPAGLRQVRVS